MSGANAKLTNILIIDSNADDTALMKEALQDTMMSSLVSIAHDTDEALKFLSAKKPDLILLAFEMHGADKQPFLQTLKSDPQFARIPVIALSTSNDPQYISQSYALGANCYIVKPANFMKFKKVVGVISDFWLGIVKLPPNE